MRRTRMHLGRAAFWIFFVPYVLGVFIFLLAGLSPAVVKEVDSLHRSLHEYAHDALRAKSKVTIQFENLDPDFAHRIVIRGDAHRAPVFVGPNVLPHGRTTLQFVAPAAGSYRMTSPGRPEHAGHVDVESEVRFAGDGARSMSLRVPEAQSRFERPGMSGWREVSRRIADASHRADHGGRVGLESLFSALNLGLGLMLIVRRPRDRTARLLAVAMIGTAVTFNHQSHSMVRDYLLGDWWFPHDLFHLASGIAYMFAVVVFPDGRLLPPQPRRRWLLRAAYGVATLVLALVVLDGTSQGHPGQPFFTLLFGLLIPVVGVAAQTYRLRHATDPVVRQQSRLLRWALLPMFVFGAIYLVLTRASDAAWVEDIGLAVFPALFALVPLALVMGILRYRLWDIDVLVSRTLLSVGLAGFIGLVYVVVVVLLGRDIGPGGSAGLKILATAIAAIAFEPVRERLARFANRLVYGERATPYEVMAEFSDRLGGAISVDEILPRIAEATVKGVGGVAGQVTAFLPGGGSRTVEWPRAGIAASFPFVLPVTYRGEQVGEIAVATAHGERLRPAEEELLAALATQAGLAVNNARLTIELQARLQEISVQAAELHASRQRIVTAREAQRQRIVQLIQERVEARLHEASAMLVDLEELFEPDVARAFDRIDALRDQCNQALDALRDLARGIFPAILADQGVSAALDAYVLQAQLSIDVRVVGMAAGERYDPQAEATVYFCVIQALVNAGTYASGSTVVVSVRAEGGRLAFSVTDDGPGVDPQQLEAGADIRDMRDRVEAFEGQLDATAAPGRGTKITGWVPVHALVST
jgi:signal transduction histidine kinase